MIALGFTGRAQAATQYFAGDGSLFTASKYGTSAAGPFTSAFVSGSIVDFGVANGTGTGGSITVGGFIATENFTLTGGTGTITNLSNGVVDINVSSGKTLDFGSQAFTGSNTAGYTKSGTGTLGLTGGSYGGGFTLNSGTVVAEGANALGAGGTGALTINGGTLAASGTTAKNFASKYSGITIGGDFQIGALSTAVSISGSTTGLTFANDVALGSSTRAITIGANGAYTFSGVISGAAGTGLTVNALAGTTGSLKLTGADTFSGPFTANGGTTTLGAAGALGNVSAINVASGALLQVGATGLTGTINAAAPVTDNGTLDISGGTETLTSLAGTSTAGVLTIGKSGSTSGSLTVGDTTSTSYAGIIQDGTTGTGTTSLTKQGTGTLTLAGANTYTGTTTINAGKLLVGGTGSATGTSAVTVGVSGTLAGAAGSATVSGLVTTNDRTSIIAPGATAASNTGTIGTLTFSAGLNLSAGATIDFDLGASSSDLINISGGTATSSGNAGYITFDFNNMGVTDKTKYTIIDTTGSTLSGFTVSDFAAENVNGKFSFKNGILYFTASVPEPATVLGGALMSGLLGWGQRRRLRGVFAGR